MASFSSVRRSVPRYRISPPAIRPGGDGHEPHDRKGHHALAAPGFPDDAHGLPGIDFQVHLVEDPDDPHLRRELHLKVPDFKQRIFHGSPRFEIGLRAALASPQAGLNASLMPSPISPMASTTRKMARPGNVTAHQEFMM